MPKRTGGGGLWGALALGLALAPLAAGCVSSAPEPTSPDAVARAIPLVISAEAEARADELLDLATDIEPELTELLVNGSDRLGLMLYGLDHRLKERDSLARKIQTDMQTHGLPAGQVEIDDTIRYTVLLDDEPPGDYDTSAGEILRLAERRGFAVAEVKNYWPSGDTYSGLNCVLVTPAGLRWELQFHTIGSLAARDEGHGLYEEFRLPGTPVERKREIFDLLVARWQWVEIPDGVLVEYSLHAKEEIILRWRP